MSEGSEAQRDCFEASGRSGVSGVFEAQKGCFEVSEGSEAQRGCFEASGRSEGSEVQKGCLGDLQSVQYPERRWE